MPSDVAYIFEVILAQAGIHSPSLKLDFRLRGNDDGIKVGSTWRERTNFIEIYS